MILIDYSQVAIAAALKSMKDTKHLDENLIRHMILNSLRYHNTNFKEEFGQLVVAVDSSNSWRKNYFSEYKANRKIAREKSPIDWNKLYSITQTILNEIRENFQFMVIGYTSLEADDVIAIICKNVAIKEQNVIISRDKDFFQLAKFDNIKKYSPIDRKFLSADASYLKKHIISGDKGDWIPNIFSDSCSKQVSLTKKRLTEANNDFQGTFYFAYNGNNKDLERRFSRNMQLIQFDFIPNEFISLIQKECISEQNRVDDVNLINTYTYMLSRNLNILKEKIEDFRK